MKEEIVVVKRVNQSRIPKDIYNDAVRSIGSGFDSKTGDIIRGLPLDLEKYIFPAIIGESHTSPTFSGKVREWYANLDIRIPMEGLTLNKATEKRELDGVTIDYPVNPRDYIMYNLIRKRPYVAKSVEDSKTGYFFEFYIEDKAALLKKQKDELLMRTQCLAEMSKLITLANSEDKEAKGKINWILEMTKSIHNSRLSSLGWEEKSLILEQVVQKDQEVFWKLVNDEDLSLKAFVIKCLDRGELTKSGNAIFNGDAEIGIDFDDAVRYFKRETNSGEFAKLKARMKELSKE